MTALDIDRYARDVAAAFQVPGVKGHHQLAAQAVLDGLERDGLLRTPASLRQVRAHAIREAIGAVAAHGPNLGGEGWMRELQRFAETVETEPEDDDEEEDL